MFHATLINSPRGVYKLTDDEVYPDRNLKNAFTRINGAEETRFDNPFLSRLIAIFIIISLIKSGYIFS